MLLPELGGVMTGMLLPDLGGVITGMLLEPDDGLRDCPAGAAVGGGGPPDGGCAWGGCTDGGWFWAAAGATPIQSRTPAASRKADCITAHPGKDDALRRSAMSRRLKVRSAALTPMMQSGRYAAQSVNLPSRRPKRLYHRIPFSMRSGARPQSPEHQGAPECLSWVVRTNRRSCKERGRQSAALNRYLKSVDFCLAGRRQKPS